MRSAVSWALCALGGAAAAWAGVPAGWLVGAMVVAVALSLSAGGRMAPDVAWTRPWPNRFGQTVIALLAVGPVAGSSPGELLAGLPLALAVTVGSMVVAFGAATLLRRRAGVDAPTALVATLPGGASLMLALARDVGADEKFVVFAQYLRLLIVALSLPVVVLLLDEPGATGGGPGTTGTAGNADPGAASAASAWLGDWSSWAMIAAAMLLGAVVAKVVPRFPAPFLIPAILGGAAGAMIWPQLAPDVPRLAVAVAFVVLGTAAGSGMTTDNLREFRRALPHVLAGVGMLLAATAVCAVLMWAAGVTGPVDSYLATAPGASEMVFGFVAERGGAGIVVIMHVVRVIAVAVAAPTVPGLVRRAGW
ncbi:AbrB family transcriptional regulator [uncultured Corynebacterium sp.]|uniref:AbrB family transcriptional regulator n=1 Tax=uncultured Corynebacterium sp. TaxID=159447 RepID=UPI0025D7EFAD|nr:AbrB family transcriptional regulator [uncultured Corynebacterium sp.]